MRNGNVETDVVFVELHIGKIQQVLASLSLELTQDALEFSDKDIHFFKIVLAKVIELLDVREDFDEFLESLDEHVEFIEDLCLRKVKSLAFWHFLNLLLSDVVSFLVLSVKFDAASEDLDYFCWGSLPDVISLAVRRNDLLSAVFDHLVGDFDEETSHFVGSVVEPGNSVYHLNGIH